MLGVKFEGKFLHGNERRVETLFYPHPLMIGQNKLESLYLVSLCSYLMFLSEARGHTASEAVFLVVCDPSMNEL